MITIAELYELYRQHPAVTTDSRVCPPDSLFFALKGGNFNGNRFAQAALDRGCAYAVVDEAEFASGERTLLVENVLETLQNLARRHRRRLRTPLIGITGTNGKTTTKELMAAVLSRRYTLLYTEGNLNNHIGVPLTLLRLTEAHEMGVIEMGANHPREIAALAAIAEPDFGIITNIGKAHLEGFGSFEGVIGTKAELYDYIRHTGGTIFINEDNPILAQISEGIEKVGYSTANPQAFVYGKATENAPFLTVEWQSRAVRTRLIGAYNTENVLAAICAGVYFGVPEADIAQAIEGYIPSNNRSQLTTTDRNRLIIDAYNANPTSMQAAIRNFAAMEAEPKMLILGDMLELGSQSTVEHQAVTDLLQSLQLTNALLVGKEFAATGSPYPTFATTADCLEHLRACPPTGYTILIKGSRGMKLEQLQKFL